MLGLALMLGDFAAWACASAVWAVRLTPEERGALAFAAMKALEPQQAEAVAERVLGGAGMPLAPFMDPLDDAAFWADVASPAELRAYALASFVRMTRREQLDFIDFAKGEAA